MTYDETYSGVDNLEVLAEAIRYNRFLVDQVVREARGHRRALDFGAGTGSLSTQVRDRGFNVSCVEADPGLRARLEQQGFECHSGFEEIGDESLDYIYSLNVLEHIEDDRAALRTLHSKLRPGGRLFLYVPAFPILYSSMDEKVGRGLDSRRSLLRSLRFPTEPWVRRVGSEPVAGKERARRDGARALRGEPQFVELG